MSGWPPHAGYIAAAYLVTVAVLFGTVLAVVLDYRVQSRAVARLTARRGAQEEQTP